MRHALVLIGFVGLCLAAGAVGGWLTAGSVRDWYPTINKPTWNPPGWIFGPVWTVLYILMGLAAWLIWRDPTSGPAKRRAALTMFAIQLALNIAWSGIFFGLHQIGWAAVEIVVLFVAILVTMLLYRRISGIASALMLPYLAWVGFASVLNMTLWTLNR